MKENELEKIFKALANRRRILIIKLLKKNKEMTVGDIARAIKLSFKSTSKHLSVLYLVGIVHKEQRNLQVFYCISSNLSKFTSHSIYIL